MSVSPFKDQSKKAFSPKTLRVGGIRTHDVPHGSRISTNWSSGVAAKRERHRAMAVNVKARQSLTKCSLSASFLAASAAIAFFRRSSSSFLSFSASSRFFFYLKQIKERWQTLSFLMVTTAYSEYSDFQIFITERKQNQQWELYSNP